MLEGAGLSVRAVPPRVDERALQADLGLEDPVEVAIALASAKADEVGTRVQGFVLAADQVLWDGEHVIGKPEDPADHLARLMSLRGREHELLTAWCLRAPDGSRRRGIARTRLTMRDDLTDAELRAYVETGEGSGCAGGYAIEGHGVWLFERIDGDWFNVVGLPLMDVLTALRSLGWRYGEDA
jgi:septum formation protein